MVSEAEKLRQRTKAFALRIIKVFRSLPHEEDARILGRQVLRSGTGVAANYRAACRSRSKAEFVAKIGVVVEETDETIFWIELLLEAGIVPADKLHGLLAEANELVRIFSASHRTARRK